MGVTVSGGAESIAAHTEDLVAVAQLFDRAAADAEDVLDYACSWAVRLIVESYGCLGAQLLEGALEEICGPWSLPRLAAGSLRDSAAGLRFAAMVYSSSDDDVFDAIGSQLGQLGHLFQATFVGAATAVGTRSPSAAAQAFLTSDPDVFDSAAGLLLFTGLEQAVGSRYPDGRPVVYDLGRDATETVAPHDLTDLVDQLAVRDDTVAGEVSVAFVIGADGRRRAIVDVPGTKSWSPGRTDDVTSLSTNARALVGSPTTYERGVLNAMTRAGVTSTDEVMLVGHSEGGMVAVTAARDAVRTGRFDVTHVVTAGSPIARSVGGVPESVRVLALENDADIVPTLDAADNPARPNVTTVQFDVDTGTVGGNHGLGTAYEAGAAETDASADPSVRAFTDSAEGFLDGSDEDTRVFLITRKY
jgi:hypothetical protein